MYYNDLKEKLNKRNNRNIKYDNNTYILSKEDDIAIRLHETDIVTLKNNGDIILNSGGWHTPTTKDRINKILYDANTNYYISQKNGIWYVGDYRFKEGITITGKGKIVGADKKGNNKKDKTIKMQVKKYAKLYADNIPLELPTGADCWHCSFKDSETNKTWGDVSNSQHIQEHIKEKYVVPSLAYNSLKENYNAPIVFAQVFQKTGWEGDRSFGKEIIQKSVYKYILKRLGYAS